MGISISPYVRQIFVASSPQTAAFTAGAIIAYPSVLLQQFKANDTFVYLDIDSSSWIASVHGIAGMPSILMPTIMQVMGIKFAFITSCFFLCIGWILIYYATNFMNVIIGEIFQGLGGNMIVATGLLIISEMVGPKLRNISLMLFGILQTLGAALISIAGFYLHWKTISLIMSISIFLAMIMVFVWPESPSWLAYKGRFEECEEAFTWLRGTDADAQKELKKLILTHKEAREQKNFNKNNKVFNELWLKITSRDFYVPCFHVLMILLTFYCSGALVLFTYSMEIIKRATKNNNAAFYGVIIIDLVIILGSFISFISIKYFKNKNIILSSIAGSILGLTCACIVTLSQSLGLLSGESLLYLYSNVVFVLSCTSGWSCLCFSMSAEILPVKCRGLSGTLYIILICFFHSTSIKISPYLFLYLDLWGTILIFIIFAITGFLFIWKCVPETKFRTLQEIEDYYNHGCFLKKNVENDDASANALAIERDIE